MNLDPGTADMTADDWHARYYGEEYEPIAPYCRGPGHLIGTDGRGFDVRIEDCPECIGHVRNHSTVRGRGVNVNARLSDGTVITGQVDWWGGGRASIDGIAYEQVRFIEVTR